MNKRLCAGLLLLILLLLGNSLVAKLFPYLFSGKLLELVWKKL